MAGDTYYNEVRWAAEAVTLEKASQAALTLLGAASPLTYNTTEALSTSGGSAVGAVTYSVTVGACSIVSGNLLKADSGTGSCSVTATMAGDTNYNDVTSAAVAAKLAKASQAALALQGGAPPPALDTAAATRGGGGGGGGGGADAGTGGGCRGEGGRQREAGYGEG